MLEPAVRPGAVSGAGQQAGKPAFENSSFHQLLEQASQSEQGDAKALDESQQISRALDALGGVGRIENAALRRVLEQGGNANAQTGSTGSTGRPDGSAETGDAR